MEKRARSLMKTLSWRIVATLTTMLLVFVFSENLALATVVGITEIVVKSVVYYLHERVWNLSSFGRKTE